MKDCTKITVQQPTPGEGVLGCYNPLPFITMKSSQTISPLPLTSSRPVGYSCRPFLFGCTPLPSFSQVPPAEVTPESADLPVEHTAIEVWFTDPDNSRPGEEPVEVVLSSIGSAQHSIDLSIYNLTDIRVAQALLQARGNGVQVRIVMESDNLEREIPAVSSPPGSRSAGMSRAA